MQAVTDCLLDHIKINTTLCDRDQVERDIQRRKQCQFLSTGVGSSEEGCSKLSWRLLQSICLIAY